jgi:hypothetical protein
MDQNNWLDFNDADAQQSGFDLIPKGVLAHVRMTLKPGGYDSPEQGWTGGYATESFETGSVYLACEFIVLEGPYAKRKLLSMANRIEPFLAINFEPLFQRKITYSVLISVDSFPLPA